MRVSHPERWVRDDALTLYLLKDMARALGVTPSAMSNYGRRGTGPDLPIADYKTSRGAPLWTGLQVQTVIAERIAAIEAMGAELSDVTP